VSRRTALSLGLLTALPALAAPSLASAAVPAHALRSAAPAAYTVKALKITTMVASESALTKAAQATQLTDAVEEHLDIEGSRLNALQAAVWPAAMSGDLKALIVAARIIEARCRLLGLIGPATKRTACQQPQTLVLRDDDCRLRGCPDHT